MKNIAFLSLVFTLLSCGTPASSQGARRPDAALLGYLGQVHLIYFAHPRQRAACLLLQNGQTDQALPLFEKDQQQHLDDLVDYIAITQIDVNFRDKEIARLTPLVNKKIQRQDDTFKLGWCLFYGAWFKAQTDSNWREQVKQGYTLRQEAWQKEVSNRAASISSGPSARPWAGEGSNRRLIIGMALAEAYSIGVAKEKGNNLTRDLVKMAAGEKAQAVYESAAKKGWKGETPAGIALSWPEQKRCELAGIIRERKNFLGNRSTRLAYKNTAGKMLPEHTDQLPPEIQSERPYLDRWYKALQATLPPEIR